MKSVHRFRTMCLVTLVSFSTIAGCSCGTPPDPPSDDASVLMSDAAPLDDAALPTRDAAPSTDAGGCLASLSAAERTDRFVGDSQERRDMERVNTALMSCAGGEGCAGATIDVGLDERVVRVRASGETEQTCAERALSGMCLPSLGGMLGREVSVCLP